MRIDWTHLFSNRAQLDRLLRPITLTWALFVAFVCSSFSLNQILRIGTDKILLFETIIQSFRPQTVF